MPRLPKELIVEILLRLPVKTLMRFRCISKSLRTIIDSPNFINSHFSRSSQNINLRRLIFRNNYTFHVCDVNLEEDSPSLALSLSLSPGKSVSNLSLGKSVSFITDQLFCGGYCNGLLLLSGSKFRLTLWNPSTRQHRDLPEIPIELPHKLYCFACTGLGYDDSVEDYKAFVMARVEGESESDIRVWIYGLKSNIWRRAQNFPYLGYTFGKYDHSVTAGRFTVDGSLHWLFTTLSNAQNSDIVAFDMRTETFSIVPQPIYSINTMEGDTKLMLGNLEGCLCISCFLYPPSMSPGIEQGDLYIRKNGGDNQYSWTKLFSVTKTEPVFCDMYSFNDVFAVGYPNRGDKILFEIGHCAGSYDLNDKSFAKVEIDNDPNWLSENFLHFFCQESLVSVASCA